jgi:hypothetical protein
VPEIEPPSTYTLFLYREKYIAGEDGCNISSFEEPTSFYFHFKYYFCWLTSIVMAFRERLSNDELSPLNSEQQRIYVLKAVLKPRRNVENEKCIGKRISRKDQHHIFPI